MEITTRATGGMTEDDYGLLETGLSKNRNGPGLAVLFQRKLFVDEWNGDLHTDDYFSGSYCITLGSGETVYEGLERASFSEGCGAFDL